MKKNAFKSIIGVALATMTLGVAFGVAAGAPKQAQEVRADEPETVDREISIRIDTYNWYTNDNKIQIHVWGGGSTEDYVNATYTDETKRECTATINCSNTTKIQIIRCKSDYTERWDYSGETFVKDCVMFIAKNDAPDGWKNATLFGTYPDGTYLRGTFTDEDWSSVGQLIMDDSDKDGYQVMLKDFVITEATQFKVVYISNGYETYGGNIAGKASDDEDNYPLYDWNGENGYLTVSGTYDLYVNTTYNNYMVVTPTYKYAARFLSEIQCPGEVYSGGLAKWTLMSGLFTSMLNDGARTKYEEGQANKDGDDFANCLARYDHIVRRYGSSNYSNFMERDVQNSGGLNPLIPLTSIEESANNGILWIAIASTITLVGVAAFFFIKRRKEDR